jgi:hypothetical protein
MGPLTYAVEPSALSDAPLTPEFGTGKLKCKLPSVCNVCESINSTSPALRGENDGLRVLRLK